MINYKDLYFDVEEDEEIASQSKEDRGLSVETFMSRKVGAITMVAVLMMLALYAGLFSMTRYLNFRYDYTFTFLENVLCSTFISSSVGIWVWIVCKLDETNESSLGSIMVLTVFLLSVVVLDKELWCFLPSYFEELENRWQWELLVLGIFPYVIAQFVKILEQRDGSTLRNNQIIFACIMGWTVGIFSVSQLLPMSYQFSVIVTNLFVIGSAMLTVNLHKGRKGNRIACIFLYALFSFGILFLKKDSIEGYIPFLYNQTGWNDYFQNVKNLFSNVKPLGSAYEGISAVGIELLNRSANPIHTLTYYFGYIPAIIYILSLLFLLFIFSKAVRGLKMETAFYFICKGALANLYMRMILGMWFTFGGMVQVEMPFAGDNYLIDYSCAAVLFIALLKCNAQNGGIVFTLKERIADRFVSWIIIDEDEWLEYTEEYEEDIDESDL